MLEIAPGIALDDSELNETFVRSSGPGGQNVNKVATAVQLRFNAKSSPALTDQVRQRLLRLAGKRATGQGEIIIEARRYRTREANRLDARARLAALVARALETPKPRRKTKPSRASKEKRLQNKKNTGRKRSCGEISNCRGDRR